MAGCGDTELIVALRAGSPEAVDVLYRRYRRDVLGFARGLVRSDHDAHDLMHEAFAKTMSALVNGYGPNENFLGYWHTAVRSAAVDWWSRDSREVPVEAGALESATGLAHDDRLDRVFDTDENERVFTALQSLPVRWQTVLWYVDVLLEPPRRVAPLMGISPNAVSALARRARTGLRTAFVLINESHPIPGDRKQ